MSQFEFVNPEFLWLFLALPLVLLWSIFKWKEKQASVSLPSLSNFSSVGKSFHHYLRPLLLVLRLLALAGLIIAIARPRMVDSSTQTRTKHGIDIIMTIDVSASMLAQDFKPNRLEGLKKVAATFIQKRVNDRIGLVLYAGESYTKTPLTLNKDILMQSLLSIDFAGIKQGTAIGLGLATAINRIKDSPSESKVIILLTDGVNNTGYIDPHTAAEIAEELGIKVYTIGIGTNGMALSPVAIRHDGSYHYEMAQVEIDEDLMKEIAENTGGQYYRATDAKKLEEIYEEIDKLETIEIEEEEFVSYKEMFRYFLIPALLLLILEYVLRYTLFRNFI